MSTKGEQDEQTEDRGIGYPVAYRFITVPGGAERVVCETMIPCRDFMFLPYFVRAWPNPWCWSVDGMMRVEAQGKSIAEAQQNMRSFADANNLPIWA